MKYIVVGDLHLGVKGSSARYHQVALSLVREICQYALTNKIESLIQVGDMFDNRKALTHDTIDTALTIVSMFNDSFLTTHLIVGNHDTSKKDSMFPHALAIFDEFISVNVVDHPFTTSDGILMLPWLFEMDDMIDAKICVGHFDINGAMMNSSGTTSKNHMFNFSDFSKYKLTLSGHYHTPNLYQHNVRYIGSPYQLTFNDMGSSRGFYVLDSDTCEVEFIKFSDYPHHFSYTDKSTDISNIEDHIVRLTFTESHGIDGDKEIIERFRALNPYILRVNYANVAEGMTEETISESVMVKEKLDILLDFYDKSALPDSINMVLLKKLTQSIYKEMKNV